MVFVVRVHVCVACVCVRLCVCLCVCNILHVHQWVCASLPSVQSPKVRKIPKNDVIVESLACAMIYKTGSGKKEEKARLSDQITVTAK